jgi:periplasmic divalent cation tolerance protein
MRVVLCNCPPAHAERIARALVEQRLAACVNVVPGVVSFYWWEGAMQRDSESTLLIKTREDLLPALREAITGMHPYTLPEIVCLPVDHVNEGYEAWVKRETR